MYICLRLPINLYYFLHFSLLTQPFSLPLFPLSIPKVNHHFFFFTFITTIHSVFKIFPPSSMYHVTMVTVYYSEFFFSYSPDIIFFLIILILFQNYILLSLSCTLISSFYSSLNFLLLFSNPSVEYLLTTFKYDCMLCPHSLISSYFIMIILMYSLHYSFCVFSGSGLQWILCDSSPAMYRE